MEESNRITDRVESLLMKVPEVQHVSRRTGRAELDEHAENVNFSEIDVRITQPDRPLPGIHRAVMRSIPGLYRFGVEKEGRSRDVVLADIRDILCEVPGVKFNIGQPISHRLDHMMSGIRSQIAVKLYGRDMEELRDRTQDIAEMMVNIPGVVDLQIEPQVDIPQVRVTIKRDVAARYGLAPADVAKALETALQGRTVSQVLEQQRTFDLVVWFDEKARNDIGAISATLISTPDGSRVALGTLAEVVKTKGPNTINRENIRRRIVVQCNAAGRDLAGVVRDIQAAAREKIWPKLQEGYIIEYGGQFEAKQEANTRLLILGSLSTAGILLLLFKCLGSWRAAVQVMANIPLAAIGSVLILLLVNWPKPEALQAASWWQIPRVWVGATTLSLAHWVGFVTLTGIVCRNGIMMISHYLHLMKYEGEEFGEKMIIRGSLERLSPVLMTAMTATIGLVPLALGAGQTGKEILHPLALVVIGGLLSSTLLDQIVTPALFYKFGRKAYEHQADAATHSAASSTEPLLLAAQFDE
jgi:Cu/Ag efflux pump CusA